MGRLKRLLCLAGLLGVGAGASAQITLTADFDSGSVGTIRRIDSLWLHYGPSDSVELCTIQLRSRIDPKNPSDPEVLPSSRWFHFRLTGVRDKYVWLNIPNTEMVRPFFSWDGERYERFEPKENLLPQTVQSYFTRDTVYVAYFAPYTHARHLDKLAEWGALPFVARDTIGYSGRGIPIEMLTVTDPEIPEQAKRRIWIHSRVHTSEAPAAWYLEALVDELTGDTPLARQLRRRAIFFIVPETNPDAVVGGYSRSTPDGVNLEIDWDHPDSLTTPEVLALKRTIERLAEQSPFDLALNLHAQSAPFVTYWIHTADSSSETLYRRKMLLSALTIDHTPYYRPVDQRFSTLGARYAEGWFWKHFGEQTLAVTFELPYTYYNNDPSGVWVSRESLSELAHSSLLAWCDLLDLGGTERLLADAERAKRRRAWSRQRDESLFFGKSYLVANRQGASLELTFEQVPEGTYEVYRWVPGPVSKHFSASENCWVPIGRVEQRRSGPLVWRYRAAARGEVFDAVLLVRLPS